MKKFILSLFALLGLASNALAADTFVVDDVIMQNTGEGIVVVKFSLDESSKVCGFGFHIALPTELEPVLDGEDPAYTLGDCYKGAPTIVTNYKDGDIIVGAAGSDAFTKQEGVLITLKVKASGTLSGGESFDLTLKDATFTDDATNKPYDVADVAFKVNTTDRVVFSELASATIKKVSTPFNTTVLRTIKANEWSTICLPFAMSSAQVKAAFGDDVLLKDFVDYDTKNDGDDIIGITLNFDDASEIEANHPYVIKVSTDITSFDVDGITIPKNAPASPKVNDNFVGNYKNGTFIPEDALFLSENKFWYSKGETKMKGFRGYFPIEDVLADKTATSRIILNFDGDATGINSVLRDALNDGKVYDLNGRQVEKPGKGVFIVNGKKVVIK